VNERERGYDKWAQADDVQWACVGVAAEERA
jgi:hypothetical protein